jgi:two-component system, cell cycle sensor histidine kinase and response regulator CckA
METAADAKVVLVVDDEGQVLQLTSRMVQRLGYDVVGAKDGEEALACFANGEHPFCAALIDLNLPGMSGEETLKELRQKAPELPALLASGYDESACVGRAEGPGPTAFIQKPYRIAALREALQKLLDEER